MILSKKDIYNNVAASSGIDVNIIESVGEQVFTELRLKMDSPTVLFYELPYFGKFKIRFMHLKEHVITVKKEYLPRYTVLLEMIKQYIQEKRKIREERYQNKPTTDAS